jgi:hypothetical protein
LHSLLQQKKGGNNNRILCATKKKKATTTLLSLPSVLRCSNTKRRQRQHALTFFAKLHPHNKKKGMTSSYRLPCYASATQQEEGDHRVPSLFSLRYNKKKKKKRCTAGNKVADTFFSALQIKKKKATFAFLAILQEKKQKRQQQHSLHCNKRKEGKREKKAMVTLLPSLFSFLCNNIQQIVLELSCSWTIYKGV